MKTDYILGLDQSTSGTKALVVNSEGQIIFKESKQHKQYYPHDDWVEHDPLEIYENVKKLLNEVIDTAPIKAGEIKVLSITNQRETVVVWDKDTGEPIYNAVVWQCRRTTTICQQLKDQGYERTVKSKTGLTIDPYFSASKVKWILDHVEGAKEKAAKGKLLLGTIDSWLIWKLTEGNVHATDVTNASRTLLFNIHTLQWDDELLEIFDIPRSMLPVVKNCDSMYGETTDLALLQVPISGVIGDSQGALFGQRCFEKGMAKATFGTGTSLLVHTDDLVETKNGLVTSVAWGYEGKVNYALEGIIRATGDVINWMYKDLELFNDFEEAEHLVKDLSSNQGVYLVPAFVGLGAPYWSPNTRAAIIGMSRATGKAHIIRAGLESIAYQVKDIIHLIEKEAGIKIKSLKVDGGATSNQFLVQYIADMLGISVIASNTAELSSMGSVYLGGLGVGIWNSIDEIIDLNQSNKVYLAEMADEYRVRYYQEWKAAVESVLVEDDFMVSK
ncbi:glycerol kinase GlpK [Aquibacillus albus]|uniref:ATP:glycerol 3-phosphotransferase n=1 Tax=Aquibacillus albus TaxID=1168171 RepID=A0ABS2MXF6_9BACI|nr:glycerol kinase GlpK [Aquibacillus albus]MBM7570579.1 glycerol kinase [Aquibacillus albus]